jgi:hypothetical protein
MRMRDGYGVTLLKVVVRCGHYSSRCGATAETLATLSGRIGEGGSIELEPEPELPEGWRCDRWDGLVCPAHPEAT